VSSSHTVLNDRNHAQQNSPAVCSCGYVSGDWSRLVLRCVDVSDFERDHWITPTSSSVTGDCCWPIFKAVKIRPEPCQRNSCHCELGLQTLEWFVIDGVKSRQTRKVDLSLSYVTVYTPRKISRSAVSVECPSLYADCNSVKLEEPSRCRRRRANKSLSRTFEIVGRLEIGR